MLRYEAHKIQLYSLVLPSWPPTFQHHHILLPFLLNRLGFHTQLRAHWLLCTLCWVPHSPNYLYVSSAKLSTEYQLSHTTCTVYRSSAINKYYINATHVILLHGSSYKHTEEIASHINESTPLHEDLSSCRNYLSASMQEIHWPQHIKQAQQVNPADWNFPCRSTKKALICAQQSLLFKTHCATPTQGLQVFNATQLNSPGRQAYTLQTLLPLKDRIDPTAGPKSTLDKLNWDGK